MTTVPKESECVKTEVKQNKLVISKELWGDLDDGKWKETLESSL